MKNLVKKICIVLLIAFAGTLSVNAQEDSPKLMKDSKEKVTEKSTEVKKAAADIKSQKPALSTDKKKQTEKATDAVASQKRNELEAAADKASKKAAATTSQNADELEAIKEKLSKTTNKEERMALEKEIKKAQAQRDLKGDSPKEGEEIKVEVNKGKPIITATGPENKDYPDLKGRELGQAKAADAKVRIENKQADVAGRDVHIEKSRERIADARKRLELQVASGEVSKEEASAKQARIDKAEARLKDYEASVQMSKQKLMEHKTTVNSLYTKD
jgi:hypothetical protein